MCKILLSKPCVSQGVKHQMQRSKHLEKGWKGTPKEKPVETVVKYVRSAIHNSSIKIILKGIRKYAKVLRKN